MAGLFDYKSYDGKIYEGLSISDALLLKQKDEEKKSAGDKTAKAQEVMARLEQLSTSGNYSLEGAMALAAKNQVFDDPNVQAYIKSMADDMVNKNTDAQFGIGNRQNMGVPPPSTQQAPANTLSGMSSGPVFGEQGQPSTEGDDTAELERFFSGWKNNSSGGSSYSPPPEQATPPAGNTVLSALNGGQPAMNQPAPEQEQNKFMAQLPAKMQDFIKTTGLDETEYTIPIRKYLAGNQKEFYKEIGDLVKTKSDAMQKIQEAKMKLNLDFSKDIIGKLPMTGPNGSKSVTTDDFSHGKVTFGTEPLPSPINKSEHHSYNHTIGGGSANSNEELTKLMAQRTEFIKGIRESGLSSEEKTNEIRKYNSFINQEAKRSGYNLPKVLDKSVVKWLGEADSWLDEQKKLPEKKRHAGYSAALRDYEAKKAEYGIID